MSLLILLAACSGGEEQVSEMKEAPITYPDTKRGDVVEDHFGSQVADPYRWLENDTSAETAAWVKQQNEVTNAYLDAIPFKDKIAKRYEEIFNFPKVGTPRKVGNKFFLYKNSGLQNQSVIYYRESLDGEDKVFIDPNEIDKNGTTSIGLMAASTDEKYIAVNTQVAGSDWQTITVYDVETLEKLDDKLEWVKFSGASWFKDGFFYSRYPAPVKGKEISQAAKNQKVYYHKIGDAQEKDVLVYEDKTNPNLYMGAGVTEGEEYATLYVSTGTDGFEQYFYDLSQGLPSPSDKWEVLQSGFKRKTSIVDFIPEGTPNVGGKFLVLTDLDAPRYRCVAVDPKNPSPENWVDVIPQNEDLLQGVNTGGGILFASYLSDVTTKVFRSKMDGSDRTEIGLPDKGTAGGFGGKRDDTYAFYYFTSFTDPGTSYKYDYETGESEVYYRPELKFNPDEYKTEQVKYTSKDGTKVPMFIVSRKDIELNGKNPTLLYGYGGFNISLSPSFSTSRIILLEQGGVLAVANLRGGGEYGEEWHEAGMLEKKQNVFDDFIAAAQYLIDKQYTDTDRLAIQGGSNGGLLVGAVMAQRPEMFAVALPAVGVMDMLRFHKFSAGFGWIPEYGCADSSKTQFDYLYAYSPLHNLKEGTSYPATMVSTADHDDRVVPAHSFKFASQLQHCHAGDTPVLIRIDVDAGHGAGKPTHMIIDEQADLWAFVFKNMDFEPTY
jgi:prolyl oligopeptidase